MRPVVPLAAKPSTALPVLARSPEMMPIMMSLELYDEDGLRLATTESCSTPAGAFAEGRKIVDSKVEGRPKRIS